MTAQERYQYYKTNHICPRCKQPWYGKQVKCDDCRDKEEAQRRKRRQARQELGLCSRCGKHPVIAGTKYCTECAEKAKKHKDSEDTKMKRLQKYHSVYKTKLKAKRLEFRKNGLCTDCGKCEPKFGVVCAECYTKRRLWYEHNKLRDFSKPKCDGCCDKCTLDECVDTEDTLFTLTPEEIEMSKQLDTEAEYSKSNMIATEKRYLRNAVSRYKYNKTIITEIKHTKEQCQSIPQQDELRLIDAENRMNSALSYIKSHSDTLVSVLGVGLK